MTNKEYMESLLKGINEKSREKWACSLETGELGYLVGGVHCDIYSVKQGTESELIAFAEGLRWALADRG